MSAPILISVPKFVAISPNPLPKAVGNSVSPIASPMQLDLDDAGRGKKRRLDHLSWDEKIQRKKLKNRVAAQTSRDRKKAKMDEMEITIGSLTEQTEILRNKCDSLQSINESLLEKNSKLDQQVQDLQRQLEELQNQRKTDVATLNSSCVGSSSNESIRSAVSNPQQQGMELKSTQREIKDNNASALWKIITLCLLYKTYSKNLIQENSKSLPKVSSQISHQTWKQALHQAAMMLPKAKAARSDCLDQWWGPQQKSWNPAKISVTA